MSEHQKKGILKVFLSSTFRDLHQMRGQLLDQLALSLESAAMEKFISTGEGPQTTSLRELNDSDIAIFLISPYYGTDIQRCEFTEKCKADCGMKNGEEKISYTWCEYRVALGENMPHFSYIVDEGWDIVSRDGASKLWEIRDEVEKEYCTRIKNDNEGVQKVVSDLAEEIIDWYSKGNLNFEKFCGRRDLIKDLFTKMRKSVNVYGVGGIGKTTLCEVALLMYRLLGRNIVYCGLEEVYASGTGYEFASEKLVAHRFSDLTMDDIIDVAGLKGELKGLDTKMKIDAILKQLDKERTILFIDNFREKEDLKELVRKGNTLNKGCILVSSKKEMEITFYRIPVEHVKEKERGNLVDIMASRLGKRIKKEEMQRIEEIAEGHPIATHLLVSNMGRVNIETLESFKKGLDFSRDSDVKGYMNRVIKSGISPKAYDLLKDLSVIEEEIGINSMYDVISEFSYSRETVGELIDASIMERIGNTFVWKYSQIRDAVLEDVPKRHKLAAEYHRKKLARYGRIEDKIEMLYHEVKVKYADKFLEAFVGLTEQVKKESPIMRLLPKLGEEIKNHVEKGKKAIICGKIGKIYLNISNYKNKSENCKKAISACEEALRIHTLEEFPIDYAMAQNNLGNAYRILAEVENKAENCKKAISACEEALRIYTLEEFPIQYAMTQSNLGNAYRILAEVENTTLNCNKAIRACEEALKVRTLEEFPIQYAMTRKNLGTAYRTLAEVEDKAENCKKAIKIDEEALRIYTLEEFPIDYAMAQNNLGNAYRTLAEVENTISNCNKAIRSYEKALRIYTLEEFPIQYAMAQNNLGNAYQTLAEVENTISNCNKAIRSYEKALKVRTLEEFPIQYAMTQSNLGNAYRILAEVENKATNCNKAITALEEALKVRTLEEFPLDYAMTQNNVGDAYRTLAEVEDKTENCKKAIAAYKEALKVSTKEKFPEVYKIVERNLKILLDFCKDQQ